MKKPTAPQVRFESGTFVVTLGEDFSHLQETVLHDLQILPLLAESIETPHLVIDMQAVKFIGSAVIGMLVEVSKTLNQRGGFFALLNANKFCQTVISMAKLNSILPSYDSIRDLACTQVSVS